MNFPLFSDPRLLLILGNSAWSRKNTGVQGRKIMGRNYHTVDNLLFGMPGIPLSVGLITPFLHHIPCGCAEHNSLQQWFSARGDFALQGTLGHVRRYFWLLQLRGVMLPATSAMPLNIQ